MKNIIFIAPPAAGKGTVSDYLVKNFNYEHISTGDLLRDEIKSGSELGQEIDALVSKGKLVSDELIIRLVSEKLNFFTGAKPFILDGFPRTIHQAEKLDEMLITKGVTNNVVIYLDIDMETATKRAIGRISCPKCKRTYNLFSEALKPANANLCDDCGVELEKRSDDTEETFKIRFNTYLDNTSPIIDYYQNKDLLVKVSATKPLEEIFNDVVGAAKSLIKVKEVKND